MYVIVRRDGAFVADMRYSTTGSSYTRNLRHAKGYQTWEGAEADSCPDNEHVEPAEAYLPKGC